MNSDLPPRESPMVRTVSTVITSLIVGALFSVAAAGTRGYHFLPAFIVLSGFVAGIGIMVNLACDRFMQARRRR